MPIMPEADQPLKISAGYYRVSTTNQSLDSQKIKVREYAKDNNYKIIIEYEDFGMSGAKEDRPGFLKLQTWIANNPGTSVLVSELDRTARDLGIFVALRKLCKENNVDLIFTDLPKVANAEVNELLENLFASVGQFLRHDTQKKFLRGRLASIKKGIQSVARTPYGYDYFKRQGDKAPQIKVNPEESDIVRTIFTLYVNKNYSINAIRKKFKTEGVKTRTDSRDKYGYPQWSRSTLRQILTNTAYIGQLYYNKNKQKPGTRSNIKRDKKEWLMVKVPPLIDKVIFDKAQERIILGLNRDPAGKKYDYLLSGLLYCGSCGRKYQFYHTNYGASFARCSDRDRLTIDGRNDWCRNPAVKVSPLEDVVFTQVKYLIINPDKLYALFLEDRKGITSSIKQLRERCDELTERIESLQFRRKRVVDAVAAGALTIDELKAYNNKTEKINNQYLVQFKNYQEEIKKLNSFLDAEDYLNFVKKRGKFVLNMDSLPFDKKRELILEFIGKVIAHKQKNHYSIEFKLPIPRVELRLKGRKRSLQDVSVPDTYLTFVKQVTVTPSIFHTLLSPIKSVGDVDAGIAPGTTWP